MDRLKALITEIHRRSLWQVLLIYIGAGWVVFEIVQTVTEGLGLPQWFPAFAALLLLIGLPVVLATAFVQEGEPAGAASDPTLIPVAEGGSAAARRRRVLTWRNAGLSFLAALAVWGVVATGWILIGERPAASADERVSIAVLPFENLSPDPDDAYFADGIHEEIISQLGKIASLRVTSRTSVMGYRNNRETSLRAIADELDVTHVLEGSVRRDGAHVRITIQLIAARDDSHLWAENYERELRGIFEVQADVAREVTAALRATLTAEEIARIEARPTGNPEAYEYFLRGRDLYLLGIDYATATELLQRAIVLDPNFALAHAFLSQARSLAYWTGERTEEELALALDAAHTALALDPSLPEAHLALGIYHYRGRRDYERALQAFADARERGLEPGRFHYAVANLLRRQGDFALALEHYREAIKHDPRSVEVFFTLATVYLWTRDYVRAETALDQAISLIPREERAHSRYMAFKARLYVAWGDREMAWAALQNPAGEYPIAWLIDRDLSGARPLFRILYDDPETALGVLRASAASLDSLRYHIVVGEVTERLDESVAARAQYDSARILIESALLGKRSDEAYLYGELGVALAGLGRFEEAKRAGEQSLALLPITKDALDGTDVLYVLAEICVMSRDSNCAVRNLELLLSQPSWVTPHWLRLDPIWDPLRDDPRFQALLDKYDLPAR